MPSPFPGMNPYLERDEVWHDFHEKFLPAACALLVAQVRPKYIVKIDEHIYVQEMFEETVRLVGRADLSVARSEREPAPAMNLEVIEAPTHILLPSQDVEQVSFLEIRERRGRDLVTVVELLSPSNKRAGSNRDQYLAKREELLSSRANLVEIDLLRGGRPLPSTARPDCVYSVMVSRADERPSAGFWPIGLRDPLPIIPIPLRPPDAEARLDLRAILHRVYDESGYEDYIYAGRPDPPLSPDDEAWARQFTS